MQILSTSTSFFLARILSPASYGEWVTLLLILSYSPIACLGTVETLLKEYPHFVGRGEMDRAIHLERIVLASIILSSLLVFIIGISWAFLSQAGKIAHSEASVHCMFVTSGLAFYSAFFYYRFSAHQLFGMVSSVDAMRSFLTFSCVLSLAWMWGLVGAVYGLLITEACVSFYCLLFSTIKCGQVRPLFDLAGIWEAVKIGFPISIIWWIFIVQASIDRLICAFFLGKDATGFYGLGLAMVSLLMLFPLAINRVIYPRLNQKIGQPAGTADLLGLVTIPSKVFSLLMPLAAILAIFITPFVFKDLFPKYSSGLLSAQLLLLAACFSSHIRNGANYLIASNRQRVLIVYILMSLSMGIALNLVLIRLGFGIEGVAVASNVSTIALTLLVWRTTFHHLGLSSVNQVRFIFSLCFPYAVMLIILAFSYILFPSCFTSFSISNVYVIVIAIALFINIVILMHPTKPWIRELYTLLCKHTLSQHALVATK